MSQTQSEIAKLEEVLKQADLKNDPESLKSMIADDAVLTGQDGRMFTKNDILTAHYPVGESKFTKYDVTDFQIKDFGSVAIVTCRVDLAGKGFSSSLRFTRVWLKNGGRWRIIAGHISHVAS